MTQPTWALVATIKASTRDTLDWAAHHIELGADHLHIYLDRPDPEAEAALAAHPCVTVITTDAAYWKMRRPREADQRPRTHQGRQFANAKWAYKHCHSDWLGHIDVDEFLMPDRPMADALGGLGHDALCARVHPVEALDSEGQPDVPRHTVFAKSCAALWMQRLDETARIYPTYGKHLNGGYLSHVAGKMFLRCGLADTKFHLHNVIVAGQDNPGEALLHGVELLHLHARGWNHWQRQLTYRLNKGSYRSELNPPTQPPGAPVTDPGALTLHQLFSHLADGPTGLRDFYDEVCAATPRLRAALDRHGHLRRFPFHPAAARKRVFGA